MFLWSEAYVVVFAFPEDVVLGHAHSLHDQLHSLQVHVAVLSQVTLKENRSERTIKLVSGKTNPD